MGLPEDKLTGGRAASSDEKRRTNFSILIHLSFAICRVFPRFA